MLLMTPALCAQAPQMVTTTVDDHNLVTLRGNTHPLARPENDQGAAADDLAMNRLLLVLKRSPEREAALRQLIDAMHDPKSAEYHHWLTPEQLGAQFGTAQGDIDKVTQWLQAHGFQVNGVSKGRTAIEFSGIHRQVREAFHTEIHKYLVNGEEHIANTSDPKIPAALAPVVTGVSALHDFHAQPTIAPEIATTENSWLAPDYDPCNGCSNYMISPGDFWTIYNATPITNLTTGKGVTIAVVGTSDVSPTDVSLYRSTFIPAAYGGTFRQVINGTDPGETHDVYQEENTMDVEVSGGAAPSATVVLVVSELNGPTDGVLLSAEYIVDHNLDTLHNQPAEVMSASYGMCEPFMGQAYSQAWFNVWQQAAAEGITGVVSAGDGGSADCDMGSPAASFGLSVSGMASTPYNVAAGGTAFYWTWARWGSNTNNPMPGTSALGYQDELAWNDYALYGGAIWEGGGGASALWPKPAWQTGVAGIPNDGARDLPDVSFTASERFPYMMGYGGQIAGLGGGTSATAPAFAGIVALLNSMTGSRQGQLNWTLYQLAAKDYGNGTACNAYTAPPTGNSCLFYDITTGNNDVPCYGGTPNCSSTTPGVRGTLPGYSATAGYDLTTGLGSINIANLFNAWNAPVFTPTALSFNYPANGFPAGTSASITVTLEQANGQPLPSTPTPTGQFSYQIDPPNGPTNTVSLPSGPSAILPIGILSIGTHTLTVSYSGDDNYAPAAPQSVSFIVLQLPQTITFPNPGTQLYGAGPVTLTATATSGLPVSYQVNSGPATVSGSVLTLTGVGTISVTASQPGNATYFAATPVTDTFIAEGAQTITFPSPGTPTYGTTPITLTATATSGLPVSYQVNSGPATVSGSVLTITGAGTVSVTASQPGNTYYLAAAPVTDTITVNPAVLQVTAQDAAIYYGDPLPTLMTYAITNFVNGDTACIVTGAPEISTLATSQSGAGNYAITISQGSLSAANYTFTFVNGNLTIKRLLPVMALTCPTAVYDGQPHSCTGSATGVGGVPVSGTWSFRPASETAVGSYLIDGTFTTSDPNYVSGKGASSTLQIDAAVVTPLASCWDKIYDGTTAADCTCTLSGVVAGDTVTCSVGSAGFASPAVGNGVAVTATGITLGGSAAGNYALSSTTATTTANILPVTDRLTAIPYMTSSPPTAAAYPGTSVVFDQQGNMYVAWYWAGVVNKFDAVTGAMSAFAGGGAKGASCPNPDRSVNGGGGKFGDGCPATYGYFGSIVGLATDANYLYISDFNRSQIHRVSLADTPLHAGGYVHELELVAGFHSGGGWNGDGPQATTKIHNPMGLAVDARGNVFWGEGAGRGGAVRMIDYSAQPPQIHTILGVTNQDPYFAGSCSTNLSVSPASAATVSEVISLTFDQDGNLYFIDKDCRSVRKVTPNPTTGVVDGTGQYTTLMGNGVAIMENYPGNPASYSPPAVSQRFFGDPWYNTNGTPAYLGSLRAVTAASHDSNTMLPNSDDLYVATTNGIWIYDSETGWAHRIMKTETAANLGCAANSNWPYTGCPAPVATFESGEALGENLAVDPYGNLYVATYNGTTKIALGTDFMGVAPEDMVPLGDSVTQQILIHGPGACSGGSAPDIATDAPFSVGVPPTTCSTYGTGTDGLNDWVVSAAFTPTIGGPQTGILHAGATDLPLDGYGYNPVAVSCDNESKTYGDPDPAFAFSASPPVSSWLTPPICAVAPEGGVAGSPYAITVSNCASLAAVGFGPFSCNGGQLTVTTRTATPEVTAANKPYDGTTNADITGCALAGVVDGDNLTCSVTAGSFASAHAGTGITVTATGIIMGGSAAGNYALSSTSAVTTANITAPAVRTLPYLTSLAASYANAASVVIDQQGNMYVSAADHSDSGTLSTVVKIDAVTGAMTQFAGGGAKGASCPQPDMTVNGAGDKFGDGCPASNAYLVDVRDMAVDTHYLYLSDFAVHTLHRVSLADTPLHSGGYVHEMEVVAGVQSGGGWNGDGPQATTSIYNPYGIAVDAHGNVFWAEGSFGGRLRMIDYSVNPPQIHTVLGNSSIGTCMGTGAYPASPTTASFSNGYSMTFDQDGNLYFVDKNCRSVRKVTPNPATGIVDGSGNGVFTTVVGNGVAVLWEPDPDPGYWYPAPPVSQQFFGDPWYNTNGTPAYLGSLRGITTASRDPNTLLSNSSDLYISTTNGIWFYDTQTGWAHRIMKTETAANLGCAANSTPPYTGCPAPVAKFASPEYGAHMSVDQYGNLYVADHDDGQITKIALGTDFTGVAPAVLVSAGDSLTQPVLIHGPGVCSGDSAPFLSTAAPFSIGVPPTTCSSYGTGTDGLNDWVVSTAFTPILGGLQTGVLSFETAIVPLDGDGYNPVTVSCDNESKTYGNPDPAFPFTASPPVSSWLTPPICAVAPEGGISGSPYAITVSNCASLAANGAGPFTCNEGQLTVTARTVTPVVTAADKTYDGTTAVSVVCALSGAVTNDDVTCSIGSASFASARVGTNITVTATGITLGGSAAGNYLLSSTTAITTANITERTMQPIPYTTSIAASYPNATSVQIDQQGNMYVAAADYYESGTLSTVVKIDAVTGVMTQFAGGGAQGASCPQPDMTVNGAGDKFGDGCPASNAYLVDVRDMAIDTNYLYLSDFKVHTLHRISLADTPLHSGGYVHEMEVVAGVQSGGGWNGDGPQATTSIYNPYGIAVDAHGNVFWAEGSFGGRLRMIDYSVNPPQIHTVLGNSSIGTCMGTEAYPASPNTASLNNGNSMIFDQDGNLYVVDKNCRSVRKVTPNPATGIVDGSGNGVFTTVLGNGIGTGEATLGDPTTYNPPVISQRFFGDPWYDTSSASIPAYLGSLRGITTTSRDPNTLLSNSSDLYISTTNGIWFYDTQTGWAHRIMKTVPAANLGCAANSTPPYTGCPAPLATFVSPEYGAHMSVDQYGNLYVADHDDGQITKIALGTDFTGVAPAVSVNVGDSQTQPVLVHGPGACSGGSAPVISTAAPFSVGVPPTTCSSYGTGTDGLNDWLIWTTFTPTMCGLQTGTLSLDDMHLPLDGDGSKP
jgi:subtilase family serine protease